jgi:prephenate dehydratase
VSTQSVTVAYQGEPGAFSEAALLALLEDGTIPAPRHSFPDVVEAVASGAVDLGLLPVENSLAGTVAPAWDALAAAALEILAETVHPIRLFVLARPGTALTSVRRVLSHPVALAQCTRFLRTHPAIEAIAVHDTAGAARLVAESAEPDSAAVAGPEAAARYGLDTLLHDVQDRADNRTRFLLVGRPGAEVPLRHPSGRRKTALMLELENLPGALLGALAPFADAHINLAHLECRPAETPWTYRFFMELEADAGEPAAARAIDTIRRDARVLRVLGSFAAAPQSESLRSTSIA